MNGKKRAIYTIGMLPAQWSTAETCALTLNALPLSTVHEPRAMAWSKTLCRAEAGCQHVQHSIFCLQR